MLAKILIDGELLSFLLKIAAAGTSGICVLALVACAYLMLNLPNEAPPAKHATVRWFMLMCFGVAMLSGASTFGAGYWDYKGKQALKAEKAQLAKTLEAVEKEKTELADTVKSATTYAANTAKRANELAESNKRLREGFDGVMSKPRTHAPTSVNPSTLKAMTQELSRSEERITSIKSENDELTRRLTGGSYPRKTPPGSTPPE